MNTWNGLLTVLCLLILLTFKTRLVKFWHNQDAIYNFRAQFQGTGSRSEFYTVSQKKTSHLWLAITLMHVNVFWYFFGRNVTDKVGNQKTLHYATSNNLCFCITWQNAETRKSHISLNWIVLHTQCSCALSSWKKKLSSVMCLIASNICWGSKISH